MSRPSHIRRQAIEGQEDSAPGILGLFDRRRRRSHPPGLARRRGRRLTDWSPSKPTSVWTTDHNSMTGVERPVANFDRLEKLLSPVLAPGPDGRILLNTDG